MSKPNVGFCDDVSNGRQHHYTCELHERNAMLDEKDVKHCPNRVDLLSDSLDLSRRWLCVFLILIVTVLAFFIVICVLSANWPAVEKEIVEARCNSPACLDTASQMMKLLSSSSNVSSPVCDNMWTSVCQSWLSSHPLGGASSIQSVRHQLLMEADERLQILLSRSSNPRHISSQTRLARLYNSCTVGDANSRRRAYRKLFDSSFGFSFMNDTAYSSMQDWRPLFKSMQVQSIDTLITIRIVSAGKNSTIIQLSPGKLVLKHPELYTAKYKHKVMDQYQDLVSDSLVELGASRDVASVAARELWGFEGRLAASMIRCKDSSSGRCYGARSPQTVQLIKLIDLSELTHMINWTDIIHAIYPSYQLKKDTIFRLINPDFFGILMRIVSSSVESVLNDYMVWSHFTHYMEYIGGEKRSAYLNFLSNIHGQQIAAPYWFSCARSTRQLLPLTTAAITTQQQQKQGKWEQGGRNRVMQSIFDRIKRTTVQYLTYSPLVESRDRIHVLTQVGGMSLVVNWTHVFSSRANGELDGKYGALVLDSEDFITNIYRILKHRRAVEKHVLITKDSGMGLAALSAGEEVSYWRKGNIVAVPDFLLHSPLFSVDSPHSVLYGGLGVILSKTLLTSSVDLINCSSKHHRSASYCACVRRSLRAQSDGSSDSHGRRNRGRTGRRLNDSLSDQVVTDAALNLLAFRMTYEAFGVQLMVDGSYRISGLEEVSPHQLMFLYYALSICSAKTEEQRNWDKMTTSLIDSEKFLRLVTSQHEIRESLQCKPMEMRRDWEERLDLDLDHSCHAV